MHPDRFDGLTRRLAAERSSRRGLLRGFAGGLASAALTGLGVQSAAAAKGGNSACATWCHANFSGKAAGQCTSDAARGFGPCHVLGSGCRTPPCCMGNGTPCSAGYECCSGTCDIASDWTTGFCT